MNYHAVSRCLSLVSFIGSVAFAKGLVVLGPEPLEHNRNLLFGRPHSSQNEPELLVSRSGYALSWNTHTRTPNWVAWEIEAEDLQGLNKRKSFVTDPDLKTYLSSSNSTAVAPTEYTNSCFDRGHQAPAASRTRTIEENQDSFIMSNIIPQTPWLNRIEWRKLEDYERKLVRKSGQKLFIISGGIYSDTTRKIGPNHDIALPTFNYKIVVALDANANASDAHRGSPMMVLKFPNINSDGSDPLDNMDRTCADHHSDYDRPPEHWPASDVWMDYQVSLQEIEAETGLQFFDGQNQQPWSLPSF